MPTRSSSASRRSSTPGQGRLPSIPPRKWCRRRPCRHRKRPDGTPDADSPLAFLRRGKERPRDTAVAAAARGRATVRAEPEPGIVATGSLYGPSVPARGPAYAAPGGSAGGVVVSATISADWPLETDGHEALLLKAENLKKRILDADPSGRRAAMEKAAEEDDTAPAPRSRTKSPRARYGVNTGNYPDFGLPIFFYVAKVSPKQRQAAMAEAFANAKGQAAELAAAAGMQCGPLLDLGGSGCVNVTGVTYLPAVASMYGDPNEVSSRRPMPPCLSTLW